MGEAVFELPGLGEADGDLLVVGGTGCLVGLCRVGRRGGDFGDVLGVFGAILLLVCRKAPGRRPGLG